MYIRQDSWPMHSRARGRDSAAIKGLTPPTIHSSGINYLYHVGMATIPTLGILAQVITQSAMFGSVPMHVARHHASARSNNAYSLTSPVSGSCRPYPKCLGVPVTSGHHKWLTRLLVWWPHLWHSTALWGCVRPGPHTQTDHSATAAVDCSATTSKP